MVSLERDGAIVSKLDSTVLVLGTIFYMVDPQGRAAAHVRAQDVYIIRVRLACKRIFVYPLAGKRSV